MELVEFGWDEECRPSGGRQVEEDGDLVAHLSDSGVDGEKMEFLFICFGERGNWVSSVGHGCVGRWRTNY